MTDAERKKPLDTDAVDRLLRESALAHLAALQARQAKQARLAKLELTKAYDLRVEAHDADPAHTAPAWAESKASHASLMAFYEQQRTRAE